MKESELQNAIDSLPRNIKPQRDLWPGINERLGTVEKGGQSQHKTPLWRTPAMAAAVLLALTSGIFIGRGLDRPPFASWCHWITRVCNLKAQNRTHYGVAGKIC